jgi:hypothetical protein
VGCALMLCETMAYTHTPEDFLMGVGEANEIADVALKRVFCFLGLGFYAVGACVCVCVCVCVYVCVCLSMCVCV